LAASLPERVPKEKPFGSKGMNPTVAVRKLSVTLEQEKQFEKLSPFELKDKLIQLAKGSSRESARTTPNAGGGNPHWIATTPRDAFFTLGHFSHEESKAVWDRPDLGGIPQEEGIAKRFGNFIAADAIVPERLPLSI
jgi:aspartate 4-decarboxylase